MVKIEKDEKIETDYIMINIDIIFKLLLAVLHILILLISIFNPVKLSGKPLVI